MLFESSHLSGPAGAPGASISHFKPNTCAQSPVSGHIHADQMCPLSSLAASSASFHDTFLNKNPQSPSPSRNCCGCPRIRSWSHWTLFPEIQSNAQQQLLGEHHSWGQLQLMGSSQAAQDHTHCRGTEMHQPQSNVKFQSPPETRRASPSPAKA